VLRVELRDRACFAHVADLQPTEPGVEPDAVGAAVTTALCGGWEHDSPCRWPNNHAAMPSAAVWNYRVLFVAPQTEETEVRRRIENALRADHRWHVLRSGPDDVGGDERALADRLASTPRPA
jgi:hypothetical protein